MTWFDDFKEGFKDRFGEGREDFRLAYYAGRDKEDKEPEGTRLSSTLGTNPTFTTGRDLVAEAFPNAPILFRSRPQHQQARKDAGMGLAEPGPKRVGQVAGTVANDLVQDHTRSLWWLLNAPQATGNVIAELAISKANPELYKHKTKTFSDFEETQMDELGNTRRVQRGIPKVIFSGDGQLQTEGMSPNQIKRNERAYQLARQEGYIDEMGNRRKGVKLDKYGRYSQRQYNPGDVAALMIPTGLSLIHI